jgi:hemerythrin-like domain-containing protein
VAALEAGHGDGWEEKACDAGDSIARLLPPHMEKEGSVLFPMAADLLSADEWDQVRRQWAEARDVVRQA